MNDDPQPIRGRVRQWRQAHLRMPDDLHARLEQKAKASERVEQSLSREDEKASYRSLR